MSHFEPSLSTTTLPETPSLTESPSLDPLSFHHTNFAIKSNNIFLEDHSDPTEAIILIQHGQIQDIIIPSDVSQEFLRDIYSQWRVEDYGDLVIFPGLVDSNVHLHANYDDDWENIAYCTNLAAAGGVTTIIDNPIMTSPYKTADEYIKSLHDKIDKIQACSKVDFGIYGLLEPKTKNCIAEMLNIGALGVKCYLMKSFQNEIGHIAPEAVQNLIKDLDKKHPGTLVVFHPETATERELFLTSPCRMEPLDKRVDLDYDIKSLAQTGAANKGSYLDEYNNGKGDNDEDSDEEDEALASPNSPTKLKGRILKLKEKTDVKDIVHFELLSYSRNNIDSNNDSSSDSDKDLFEKLGQSDGSRTAIGSESPERCSESPDRHSASPDRGSEGLNEDAGSGNFGEMLMIGRNSSLGGRSSPVKKSRFARLKGIDDKSIGDSERGRSPDSEKTEGEVLGPLFKKLLTLQAQNEKQDKEEEEVKKQTVTSNTQDVQEIEKLPMLRITKSDRIEAPIITFTGESPPPHVQTKTFHPPSFKANNKLVLELLEESDTNNPQKSPENLPQADEQEPLRLPLELLSPTMTLPRKDSSPSNRSSRGVSQNLNDISVESEGLPERPRLVVPRKSSKFLTVVVNNSPGSSNNNPSSPELLKKASFSNPQLQQSNKFQPLIQIGRPGNAGFRLTSPFTEDKNSLPLPSLNVKLNKHESCSRSPDSHRSPRSNQPITPISNLLQRRALSRQSSCNTSTVSSPTAIRTMVRFGSDLKGFESPPQKREAKFNQSYKTFLANRPQSWEENAVSRVLNCYKKGNSLRIVFHNLSLASSFLKIRQKKKKNSHYREKIFGDTGPGYLFFNEKAIKDGDTKFKVSPPFRNKENQRLLVETLRLGGVDVISSYHFFVPPQYKQIDDGNFRRAFGGTESMGCSLQATYTALYQYQQKNNKRFTEDLPYQKETVNKILKQAYKALCANPAQMLKISHRKGTIAKGKDADFVVWDPTKIDQNHSFKIYHLFNGKPLRGMVHKTFLRGTLIYDRDEPVKVAENYAVELIKP